AALPQARLCRWTGLKDASRIEENPADVRGAYPWSRWPRRGDNSRVALDCRRPPARTSPQWPGSAGELLGQWRAAVTQAIEVRDLVVVLGGRRILHGLSFTVPTGQVTGLLGPSGCGKTTLMRCLVGVQQICSGEVRVLGAPAGSAPLRHRVGYV